MPARKAVTRSQAETNPTVVKKLSRAHLSCPICPPNRGENRKRKPKHGTKKPGRKTHR